MTTHVPAARAEAPHAGKLNYLNVTRGFWSWAGTLDHKRIGLMYLAGTSLAFLCGGLLGQSPRQLTPLVRVLGQRELRHHRQQHGHPRDSCTHYYSLS